MLFSGLFLSCRSLEGVKAQAVTEIFLKLINVLSAGPGLNRGAKGGISQRKFHPSCAQMKLIYVTGSSDNLISS